LVVTVTAQAAPEAEDDTLTTSKNTPGTRAVLENDTSFDGSALTLVSVTDGEHGSARVVDDEVVYTPEEDYVGRDSVTYVVKDRLGRTSTGTLDVVVVEDALPVAAPDVLTVPQASTGTRAVLENDTSFDGSALTLVSVTDGAHGSARVEEVDGVQVVRYTPEESFVGVDSVTYVVRDRLGQGVTGTLAITVTAQAGPTTAPDALTTKVNTPGASDVVRNDSSFDGSALTLVSVTDGAHGSARVVDSKVVYTPQAGFTGTDSVSYVVRDRLGRVSDGVLSITVEGAAPVTAPVAAPVSMPRPSASPTSAALAYTGAETNAALLLGGTLIAGGVLLTVVTHRKPRRS
jgi:hypothetical protein